METNATAKKERNSNFEIFRIMAMALIVMSHFAVHTGLIYDGKLPYYTRFWSRLLSMGGKLGVNCFVLISGFFLSRNTRFDVKKLLVFYAKIIFFSVVISAVFYFAGKAKANEAFLQTTFMPIVYARWWFATTYFVLFLLHPFLNKMLAALSKREFLILIAIVTVIWSVIPTLTNQTMELNSLLWFIALYVIAAYVRIHDVRLKSGVCFLLAGLFALATYGTLIYMDLNKLTEFGRNGTYYYDQQRLPMLAIAFFLFLGFKNRKSVSSKAVNVVASGMFGVYLLHDNSLVRAFLWKESFPFWDYAYSPLLIPYSLGVCAGVFAVCTLLSLAYTYGVERPVLRWLEKRKKKAGENS